MSINSFTNIHVNSNKILFCFFFGLNVYMISTVYAHLLFLNLIISFLFLKYTATDCNMIHIYIYIFTIKTLRYIQSTPLYIF